MYMRTLLSACTIALLLVGGGTTPGALAGEGVAVEQEVVEQGETPQTEQAPALVFNGLLGAGTTADVFRITCLAGCVCARVTVTNPAGGPGGNRFVATLVGDLAAGDGTFFAGTSSVFTPPGVGVSPQAQVCQGPGQYLVAIYKTEVGTDAYTANLRCASPAAGCPETVVTLQNQ